MIWYLSRLSVEGRPAIRLQPSAQADAARSSQSGSLRRSRKPDPSYSPPSLRS